MKNVYFNNKFLTIFLTILIAKNLKKLNQLINTFRKPQIVQ